MQRFSQLCIAALFAIVANNAHSVLITHQFTGTITDAEFRDGDPFGGQIQVGTEFSGFYQFDGSQLPGCNAELSQCILEFPIPPYRFSVTIGSLTFEAENEIELVVNNDVGDPLDFYSVLSHVDFGNWLNVVMALFLEDPTGTAIDDARDPFLDPPNLNDFAFHELQINASLGQGFVQGELETLQRCEPFPGGGATGGCFPGPGPFPANEPSMIALIGIALAGLGFSRRKRAS